jgi:hypothetical protein
MKFSKQYCSDQKDQTKRPSKQVSGGVVVWIYKLMRMPHINMSVTVPEDIFSEVNYTA